MPRRDAHSLYLLILTAILAINSCGQSVDNSPLGLYINCFPPGSGVSISGRYRRPRIAVCWSIVVIRIAVQRDVVRSEDPA